MRKLAVLMSAAVMMLVLLAGCGADEKTGGESSNKKIRIVTDAEYAPFEYRDKGKIIGFDVDLIKAAAKEAGYEMEIEHVGWEPLFDEIKSKRADAALSAITINDDRKVTYDFSIPYFTSTNKILASEETNIQSAADLKGKKVGVQAGTTGQAAAESILGKNSKNIKQFENNNLAILELNSGGVDAVVADNAVVEEYAKNNPKQKLKVTEDPKFDKEYYGIMVPKGSKLAGELSDAVNKLFENGTYAEIYKKWFGTEPDIDGLKAQQ